MSDWNQVPLGSVASVIPGFAFKSRDWCSEGRPVLKIKNIRGDGAIDTSEVDCIPHELMTPHLKRFEIRDGDILLAMTGATAGKVGKLRSTQTFLLNQRVAKLVPTDIDPIFFWSVISSEEYQYRFFRLADGAAQPNMSASQIESVLVPAPPLETQRRIAGILGAYDDLIEVNRRRIAVLEEMARGLFTEWFIRLRFPGHEEVATEDTPDGALPAGWRWGTLGDFLTLQRGFDLPSAQRIDGAFPIVSASGVTGSHAESRVSGPGVATGRSGTIGQVHLVMGDFWPLNTALYVKEFKKAGPAYATLLLRHLDLSKYSTGAAVPTLNRNHVHGIKLTIAPAPLLNRFEQIAMANFKAVDVIRRESETLAAARDLLLPRLISGQLSVTQAERELEAA